MNSSFSASFLRCRLSCSFLPQPNPEHQIEAYRFPMERGGGGDDSARAVGMCDRFLTFLAKNLSMNRQKNITEVPRNGGGGGHAAEEDEEDEFTIRIEKAEFELSHEDGGKSVEATVLEDRHTDVSTARAAADEQKREKEEEGGKGVGAEAAAAAQEKVRRSLTIKGDRAEAAGDKDAAAKKSKKRQAASASASVSQLGAGGEEAKPPRRAGLRPRMPAILRVPTNINEQSSTFIEERRKGFGRSKTEK